MKAVGKYIIIRFRKEDLEILKKQGLIYYVDPDNKGEHICSIAVVESSNHPDIMDGDEAIVSYRIAWDENVNDRGHHKTNKYFIETLDNGDQLRWCHADWDVFGIKRKGKYLPLREYIFGEIPPPMPEKTVRGIIIPDSFRKQKTDKKQAYLTKVKEVNPLVTLETGIEKGDYIWCEPDSDIKKTIFEEEILTIPFKKVLGWANDNGDFKPLPAII